MDPKTVTATECKLASLKLSDHWMDGEADLNILKSEG